MEDWQGATKNEECVAESEALVQTRRRNSVREDWWQQDVATDRWLDGPEQNSSY